MGIFDIFKKNTKIEKDLFDLPCDYDGYELVFNESTNPMLYVQFNDVMTDNKLNINDMPEYQALSKDYNSESFDVFYDAWVKKLLSNNFVTLLDNNVNITDFVININKILIAKGENSQINVSEITERYTTLLKNYTINGNKITDIINYDILEANIVAEELRKLGYELICLFNGYDNNIKTFIKIQDIDSLKELEQKIGT